GKVGRASAAPLPLAEEPLHDPVLERVEGDDGEAAAGLQHLERRWQGVRERVELVVDRDPQSLEDPLRRMSVAEPRRRRDRCLDRVHELAGALEWLFAPATDDRAGDLLRVPLFAVAAEDRHEVALAPGIDDVARALVLARIH